MKKIFLTLVLVLLLGCFGAGEAFAASISIGASKTTVSQNDAFTATVSVNTQGVAINNAEGVISFPEDLLSVESINLNGSIFSIWVEQPAYSNVNGTVSFNGGTPNPGYNGVNGTVLRIVFRAKKTGTVSLSFLSADVYANDGLGTNVTSEERSAPPVQIVTKTPVVEEPLPVETPVVGKAPGLPHVTSSQAPDPEAWYSAKSLGFAWDITNDISTVQLAWGANPVGTPSVSYSPAIRQKTISDIPDGTWYLHARFRNATGWGPIAHRKFKVDTVTPKDLNVSADVRSDARVSLQMTSTDAASGIARYEVLIDGAKKDTIDPVGIDGRAEVTLPRLAAGQHTAVVSVYDRAGNSSKQTLSFVSPEIETPKFLTYPDTLKKGEQILATGTTYPDADIRATLELPDGETRTSILRSDTNGAFSYKSESIEKTGIAMLYAEVLEGDTAASLPSSRISIPVEKSELVKTSLAAIDTLMVVIPAVALLFILIAGIFIGFYKLRALRSRLREDVKDLRKAARKSTVSKEEVDAIEKIARDVE